MKKLLSLITIAVLSAGVTFAQTAPAAKQVATVKATAPVAVKKTEAKVATVKATAPAVKVQTKKVETKVATAPAAAAKKVTATTNAAGVKLKADGTPDKRYKTAVSVAGPKKKDGTADMRYKVNKAAAKKN